MINQLNMTRQLERDSIQTLEKKKKKGIDHAIEPRRCQA